MLLKIYFSITIEIIRKNLKELEFFVQFTFEANDKTVEVKKMFITHKEVLLEVGIHQ